MHLRLTLRGDCVVPLLFAAAVACTAVAARSQTSVYTYPAGVGPSSSTNPNGSTSPSTNSGRGMGYDLPGLDANLSHRQVVSRREELKKRMTENAARLLALTRDLQQDLQTREANDADAKRLDEIAKLARSVRDQMRQ